MKHRSIQKFVLTLLVFLFFSECIEAQLGAPVPNWTILDAAEWAGPLAKSDELHALSDVTPAIPFVGVDPCRIVDTRGPAGPFGAPSMAAGVTRNFDLNNGPCAGIPAGVDAYSLNVTVTNTAGPGIIKIFPQGGVQPIVSTLNYVAGQTIANAAIVPAGTGGGVTVIAGVSGTDLIIDINGYFSDSLNPSRAFQVFADVPNSGVIAGQNSNLNTGSFGVAGTAASSADGAAGVLGYATGSGGFTFGVYGLTNSTGADGAGVKGVGGYGDPLGDTLDCGPCFSAGVRGVNNLQGTSLAYGVLGISRTRAVGGVLLGATGIGATAAGYSGYFDGASPYAFYGSGNLHVTGIITASMKPFVQPHPRDPGKEIVYISLEGPASEVYFRGTAQVARGISKIEVPDHFRAVARPGSYSTLVTPVGAMATVAVVKEDVDGIVVRASRDVKVHYVVYAERSAFPGHQPIADNTHFRPESARGFESGMPESYRRMLVENGVLNPDGTANRETADRLGWTKIWLANASAEKKATD